MKKVVISLLLILMLIMCSCGKKKTEEKGGADALEPVSEVLEQPVEVVPAAGDDNSVGLMAFYPNNNENMYALAGTNTLTLYFENKGITLGTGKIGIYQKSSGAIYTSVETAQTDNFLIGEMDSVGTSLTGWESGTKIDIFFDKTFLALEQYYVLMDEGCFKLGSVNSGAVTNETLVTFGVKNYGVDTSLLGLDTLHNVGDVVTLNIMVDGEEASMYAFTEFDETFIQPAPLNATEGTTATLTFLKEGTQDITCAFYKSGKKVDSITFTFEVAVPADESGSAVEAPPATGGTAPSASEDDNVHPQPAE